MSITATDWQYKELAYGIIKQALLDLKKVNEKQEQIKEKLRILDGQMAVTLEDSEERKLCIDIGNLKAMRVAIRMEKKEIKGFLDSRWFEGLGELAETGAREIRKRLKRDNLY